MGENLKLSKNAEKIYDGIEIIINAFKNKVYHFTFKKSNFDVKGWRSR